MLALVADGFGFHVDEIISQCRELPVTEARFAFYHLARRDLKMPQKVIGRLIKRDHGSVKHGVNRADAKLKSDAEFRLKVSIIRARLREWAGDPLAKLDSQPSAKPARSVSPHHTGAAPV